MDTAYTAAMESLVWSARPTLRKGVLVCAFYGWNDGGEAATSSALFLQRLDIGNAFFNGRGSDEPLLDVVGSRQFLRVKRAAFAMSEDLTMRDEDASCSDFCLEFSDCHCMEVVATCRVMTGRVRHVRSVAGQRAC